MLKYRPVATNEFSVEGELPETHMLFTCGIAVTLEQHLELLASPRKCNLLGIDGTFEREVYGHRHEWYGWPELPLIDPNEEVYPEGMIQ